MTDYDLFGEPILPPDPGIPTRANEAAYWRYINSLRLPDGLKFLTLAPSPSMKGIPVKERRYCDAIYCQDPRTGEYDIHLVIDIRTGQRWSQ
jgi:hypothetical protein